MEHTYWLSWPPSTNSLWRSFRGRNILSARARKWSDDASRDLLSQGARSILGPVEVSIELCSPWNKDYDPDNRIKSILDLLVRNQVIEDDNHKIVRKLTVSIGEDFKGAKVTLRKANGKTTKPDPSKAKS